MKRRTFLQVAGAMSAAAAWGGSSQAAAPPAHPAEGATMRIDSKRVENRNQNRSAVTALHGMVCTSQPLATAAGVDILKAGGNAIDAAIGANAMLGLVEPMNCGIGGDLFAIVWIEKERKLYGLNASGRAPYGWNIEEATKLGLTSIPPHSPLAWSVPGCVSGWQALGDRFGTRKLGDLLAPAIACAREGFAVTPIIAADWPFDAAQYPTLTETFMPGGRAPAFGEVFKNAALAETYALLARDGAGAFYQGEIAERIVRFSQANGGRFSARDFAEHTATWVEPVTTSYHGYDVWELPPNGQGCVALQILNMLECFDIAALAPNSAAQLHLFIEAKKLAFEDRAVFYADPEFAEVPVAQLISKAYGKERAALIDPKRASQRPAPGHPSSETIYMCTADNEGNMVSLIQSTFHGWGSHIVPDRLGFAIQNRGMSFALDPKHRNKLEPHKRPFHTIIPAFVTRGGNATFAFGVMGGDFQPQGHSQVLMNLIDFGLDPQQAGEQPRVEHAGSSTPAGHKADGPGIVNCERLIPDEVKRALAEMGHRVSDSAEAFGGYQGIWREENPRRYFGGSDPRKDGCAFGE